MKSVAAEPLRRERSLRAVVVAAVLLLAALGALAWFAFAGSALNAPAPDVQPRTTVAFPAPSVSDAEPAREAAGTPDSPQQEAASLCTFLDGVPVPSLVRDVTADGSLRIDWAAANPRHAVPAAGERFAVLARDCQIMLLARAELPQRGERRVDLTRAPVLDVRFVNMPATLRERMHLWLQLDYGVLERGENRASIALGRGPFDMNEDRVLVPLVLPHPGHVVVHAKSRHSMHSYPTPKVPFEPVSQVIEIDCGVLAPAGSLADLSLTLRFPYAHPAGSFDLSIQDGAGSNMMRQRRERADAKELHYVFRDLPRALVHPVLGFGKSESPPIHLEPIDLIGGSQEVVRDVVAESSLRVVVAGREGLTEDGVSILLRRERGDALVANWPRGTETRFEHLTAATVYAQAIAYKGHRCSTIVRVDVGTAQAHELALQMVPGGRVEIAPGAFGDAVRSVDVHYPGADPCRVFLRMKYHTSVWLPLGQPRVDWSDGSRTLRVEPGVITRWP